MPLAAVNSASVRDSSHTSLNPAGRTGHVQVESAGKESRHLRSRYRPIGAVVADVRTRETQERSKT